MAGPVVRVGFLGDASQLARESERASRSVESVGKHAVLTGSAIGTAFGTIAGRAIGDLAGKLEGWARESASAYKTMTAQTVALSRVTGQSAEDTSRLIFAAKETGVEFDTLAKLTGRLEKNLVGADLTTTKLVKTQRLQTVLTPHLVKGHIEYARHVNVVSTTQKVAQKATESLGFAIRDANGHLLPMSTLLPKIADKFAGMQNGPEKTALALKLFGREGVSLLPLLNKGADGLAKFGEEADKLGITMSGKDVASYRQYVAAQRSFHAAMDGIKISLGRELFPLFTQWSKAIADNAPQINRYARALGDKLVPFVERAGRGFHTLAQGFADGTGPGGQIRDVIGEIGDVGRTTAEVLDKTLRPTLQFLVDHGDIVKGVAEGLAAYKAASVLGLTGSKGVGAVGSLGGGGVAGPSAVFVTNWPPAFGVPPGGGPGVVPGGDPGKPGAGRGGKLGGVVKKGTGLAGGPIGLGIIIGEGAVALDKHLGPLSSRGYGGNTTVASVPKRGADGLWHNENGTYTRDASGKFHPVAPNRKDTTSRADQAAEDAFLHNRPGRHSIAAANRVGASAKTPEDLAAEAKRQNDALALAALKRQQAADALQAATDKVRQALDNRRTAAQGVRDSLIGSNSIVRDGVSWTAKDLLSRFTVTMDKVKRFQTALSALSRKGFSQTIIEQVSAAGVQGGMGTAVGLSHASAAQVAKINATQSAISRAAGLAGDASTHGMGRIQITSVLKVNDRELARAVNEWNARNGFNGHQLAS